MHTFANPPTPITTPRLIAGHAAGDLTDTQASAAAALLASCSDCTSLHRDLVAISAATAPSRVTPTPPRDFRLTPSRRRAFAAGAGSEPCSDRSPPLSLRPMAAAFTSLGVAGLLVAPMALSPRSGRAGVGGAAPLDRRSATTLREPAPALTAAARDTTARRRPARVVQGPRQADDGKMPGSSRVWGAGAGDSNDADDGGRSRLSRSSRRRPRTS